MTVVELVEYQDRAVDLDRADVEFLQATLGSKIRVTRPPLGDGYILNPQQYVGVVRLPTGRILRCQSKVPITNLTKMLAEAIDLPELLKEQVQLERIDDLLELTARHFVSLVLRLIDAGMYRAYVEQTENRTTIRGRIAFAEDVRTNYALRHRTVCQYAELTWDIPENQVIRQVLRLLAAQPMFSRGLRNDLRSADASMYDVSEGRLQSSDLDRFQYQRFNVAYEPVHRLCRLFLEGASLSEELGSFDGRAFLVDMNMLFERFVTRVLQKRCPVGMRVRDQVHLHLDEERTIPIRPDLVVQRGTNVVRVADCKYKPAKDDFRNSDVYQLLAYCTVMGAQDGMLIYPRSEFSEGTATVHVRESPISIHQRTIDLAVSPALWDGELVALANAILEWSRPLGDRVRA